MKNLVLFSLLSVFNCFAQVNSVGSGNCLDFESNTANNNYCDLGNLTQLNTSDFTFECWMKVNTVTDDEAFFSNKDWSSGNNTGFVFDVQDNGSVMKFNFKDPSNPRKDLSVNVDEVKLDWFHFAATYKRGGYFTVYINGVAKDSLDVSSITGSFLSAYTYKLGQDGTGNYFWNGANPKFNGKIDEVRIWDDIRSVNEIRTNMCKKVSTSAANLYAYYTCDETTGTTLTDSSVNGFNGSLINSINSIWKISGAPIGDESLFLYGANIGANNLEFTSSNLGNFKLSNILNSSGIHLYKVANVPVISNGLNLLVADNSYYGVFSVDTNAQLSYKFESNFSTNSSALLNEANLLLYNRVKSDAPIWSIFQSNLDLANNIISKSDINYKKEFILGLKSTASCDFPTNILNVSSTINSATFSWVNGSTPDNNIQWGPQGFVLGNGTAIVNTSTNPTTISGLIANNLYDFYIQDTCNASGSSTWVGPFPFTTLTCAIPSNLSATNITYNAALLSWTSTNLQANFDIEWGPSGFTLGLGIPVSGISGSTSYLLNGLAANTEYAYYVRTNCGGGSTSFYAGPFIFTTTINDAGVESLQSESRFKIFPNPSKGNFNLEFSDNQAKSLKIVNVLGETVYQENQITSAKSLEIDLSETEKGLYYIILDNQSIQKLILN
jgi:hypothetical protein